MRLSIKYKRDGVATFMITIIQLWVFSVLQNVSSNDILYDNLDSYFLTVKYWFQISKVEAAGSKTTLHYKK